jgi:hypothetical protein
MVIHGWFSGCISPRLTFEVDFCRNIMGLAFPDKHDHRAGTGSVWDRWPIDCRSVYRVEFSQELRTDVLTGRITVSFRLWRRPKVKVGGRYRVEAGQIEVDSVELVPFSSIDDADLRRSGETDVESLRRRAAHAGPIQEGTLVYRIEFHVVE